MSAHIISAHPEYLLLLLVLFMIICVACGLVYYATCRFKHVGDSTNNSDHNKHPELAEDWSEYTDHEVWVAARKILGENSLRRGYNKKFQQENQSTSGYARISSSNGDEVNGAEPRTNETNYTGLPSKGDREGEPPSQPGFTLDKPSADLLLVQKVYFIHFPSIYCYDNRRIICRIREGPYYHQVTTLVPNPPALQVPFDIGGITYCFDEYGVLWYLMEDLWLQETTYTQLNHALTVVVNCIEANNLHITADPIYSLSNGDPGPSTSSGGGTHGTNMDVSEEDGLRALSASPDQEEIDNWMDEMKRYRAMQVKEGIRLSPVQCPVSTCGKVQRRPQALRDHLYFHFSIKPYRCDYGCDIGFETEANKNRHLETCPIYWAGRYH